MDLIEKVDSLLKTEFPPPAKVDLVDEVGIIGTVTSECFEGLEAIDRTNWIRGFLDEGLTNEERRRVVAIVAATPGEAIFYSACAEGLAARPDGREERGDPQAVLEKVESLLTIEFPPPDKVDLMDEDGIIGTVTSGRFADMRAIDRINWIWDLLSESLTNEERRRVIIIVAANPDEETAHPE
jgi:hypothetical protein